MNASTANPTTTRDGLPPNVVTLSPPPSNLLTALVDYHVSLICQPAEDALSATGLAQLRRIVGRLVNAGRLDDARQLVALNIEVVSVAAEATRHMWQSVCRYCPDFWKLCPTLDRLEGREDDLHHQIARLGGF